MLVSLAVTWLPYGSPPPEQIWEGFGISPEHYWHRLRYLLTHRRWLHLLDATTVTTLRMKAMTQLNPLTRR
ncbi:hypothetical protein ACFVKB_29275 [Rhodococcus sp. NPDC127530]|uniref:hypothetical protein n=1 Tax=Rhodococcus sp. NPDC127530 TaxID=3345397 RepID=UPI00362D2844